jgi:hypothetical protein
MLKTTVIKSLFLIIGLVAVTMTPPYIGGIYYSCCGSHLEEQIWLDRCVMQIRLWEKITPDPELKEILNYAATKYNKIGAWHIMVFPLPCWPGEKVLGCNNPYCPGITIDTSVSHLPIRIGAHIIIHESLHDTYLGHSVITPIMERVDNIGRIR